MIAYSTDNLFVECCDVNEQGEESCTESDGGMVFPNAKCDFVGIAFGKLDLFFIFLINAQARIIFIRFRTLNTYFLTLCL